MSLPFTQLARQLFSLYNADGSARQPGEGLARWGTEVEQFLTALAASELDIEFPYGFILAENGGAGTPNAIVATTSLTIPPQDGGALIILPIVETNTGSPVTVSFNGAAAIPIKSNSGNDIAPGGLTAGMIVAGFINNGTFRILNDQVSASIVAAAEAAQQAAEDARDQAEAAAASASGIPTVTSIQQLKEFDFSSKSTVNLFSSGIEGLFDINLISSLPASRQAGLAADDYGIAYVPSEQDLTYAWVRRYNYKLNVLKGGAKGNSNGTTGNGQDDAPIFQSALNIAKAHGGGEIIVPETGSSYRLGSRLVFDGDHISFRGTGFAGTMLYIDHTDLAFEFGVTRFCSWTDFGGFDIRNRPDGHHILNLNAGLVYGVVEDLYVQQRNVNRRALDAVHNGDSIDGTAKQTIETTFQRSFYDCTAAHANYLLSFDSTDGARVQAVTFERLRLHARKSASSLHSLRIAARHATAGFTGNRFVDIVGEQNVGGLIQLTGARSPLMERISVHDLGTEQVVKNMIEITASPSGARSDAPTIIDYVRTQGELASGTYDIALNNMDHATVIGCTAGLLAVSPFKLLAGNDVVVDVIGSPGEHVTSGTGRINKVVDKIKGSRTFDLPSIADGASTSFTITVTGAQAGDKVEVWPDGNIQGMGISATCHVADSVTVVINNNTGSAKDPVSMTFYALVTPKSEFGF